MLQFDVKERRKYSVLWTSCFRGQEFFPMSTWKEYSGESTASDSYNTTGFCWKCLLSMKATSEGRKTHLFSWEITFDTTWNCELRFWESVLFCSSHLSQNLHLIKNLCVERIWKKNGYVFMYNLITVLYSRIYHHLVNYNKTFKKWKRIAYCRASHP